MLFLQNSGRRGRPDACGPSISRRLQLVSDNCVRFAALDPRTVPARLDIGITRSIGGARRLLPSTTIY